MDLFSDNLKIENLDVAVQLFRESRAGFLTLFNNSPICMSMTTTSPEKRVYVRVNQKFLEKFGFDEREIIGRTSVETGILDREESIRVGELISEKGRLQNDYVKCIAKDGKIVHTVSSIEKMEMNGEVYLVSFFVDITKVIEQQSIIEKQMQQLEAINKDLEAFSYSVSHDLRAPLRAVSGYAKMLEEDFFESLNDEGKRLLLAVQQNAKRMEQLIGDLLTFARMGKRDVNKTKIDMPGLIGEVLSEFEKLMEHRAQIIIGVLHPVNGDPSLIRQVMINLISNAIKYSSKKESPRVEIISEINNEGVVYMVKDNGEGFDMKYAGRLFGVFQRLHTNQEFEGTGIGLSIVQRIISKHGGTIRAEAEQGKGATFIFNLPH